MLKKLLWIKDYTINLYFFFYHLLKLQHPFKIAAIDLEETVSQKVNNLPNVKEISLESLFIDHYSILHPLTHNQGEQDFGH